MSGKKDSNGRYDSSMVPKLTHEDLNRPDVKKAIRVTGMDASMIVSGAYEHLEKVDKRES